MKRFNLKLLFITVLIAFVLLTIASTTFLYLSANVGEFVYDNKTESMGKIKGVTLPSNYIVQWQDGTYSKKSLNEINDLKILNYSEIIYYFTKGYSAKSYKSFDTQKIQLYDKIPGIQDNELGTEVFRSRRQDNFISRTGELNCEPRIACEEWEVCKSIYDIDSVLSKEIILGNQYRFCRDYSNCISDFIDSRQCKPDNSIYTKKTIIDSKEYLEIYNSQDDLVSRLNKKYDLISKLNIEMIFGEMNYPDHCSDNIRNYMEDEVDCVYENNGDCPVCKSELPTIFTLNKSTIYIIVALFIIFFLISYLLWSKKYKI